MLRLARLVVDVVEFEMQGVDAAFVFGDQIDFTVGRRGRRSRTSELTTASRSALGNPNRSHNIGTRAVTGKSQ
ncbi:hypothetical protein C8258_00580 [Nocardia sp. MDA0666]|nr:hypothetical protein C8258_00580 [Nocardia sp. MDA0666]